MVDQIIRPSALPRRTNPVASEIVPVDNGTAVAGSTLSEIVNAGRPVASRSEAEAGANAEKAMTPLTTKQAIDQQVPPKIAAAIADLNLGSAAQADTTDFATAAQGSLADSAVQPGSLAAVATSGDYDDLSNKPPLGTMASENTADWSPIARALPPGGTASQVLIKSSGSDYDTEWATSSAVTAVSYAAQSLTPSQRRQARENIGVFYTESYDAGRRLAPLIGGAFRLEPLVKNPSNPIIPKGGASAWDEGGIRSFIPAITEDGLLAQLGGNYFGYYYGINAGGTTRAIGRANSADGNSWAKQGSAAVFSGSGVSGRFDEGGVATGNAILMNDETVRLYYSGLTAELTLGGMGIATSANGTTFTRPTTPAIPLSMFNLRSGGVFGMPFVTKTSIGWLMVCEGEGEGFGAFSIYGAHSADGLTWTALNNGYPIFGGDPNSWSRMGVANPKLMELDPGHIVMTFNGQSTSNFWRCAAVETRDPNLANWTEVTRGPFLAQGSGNAWDSHRIEDAFIVKDDIVNAASHVRVFYFGTNADTAVVGAQIGMGSVDQSAEYFPHWLADQAGFWTATSVAAPWGSAQPAIEIDATAAGSYGYIASRPFALGRRLSARFTIWVSDIPSSGTGSRGFRVSLRAGPDTLAQATAAHPSIVARRNLPSSPDMTLEYYNSSTSSLVSLGTLVANRAYHVELVLDSAANTYDVFVTGGATFSATGISAGSTLAKHCLVVDGFSQPNGVLLIGDVMINSG